MRVERGELGVVVHRVVHRRHRSPRAAPSRSGTPPRTPSPSRPRDRPPRAQRHACPRASQARARATARRTPASRRWPRAPRARPRHPGSIAAGWPYRCTGMIARVRALIDASTASGSMQKVSLSMSTKTACAPPRCTAFAVAAHENDETITSSPRPMPRATSAMCSALVPLSTATHRRPPDNRRELLLERRDLRTRGDRAAREDSVDGLALLIAERHQRRPRLRHGAHTAFAPGVCARDAPSRRNTVAGGRTARHRARAPPWKDPPGGMLRPTDGGAHPRRRAPW